MWHHTIEWKDNHEKKRSCLRTYLWPAYKPSRLFASLCKPRNQQRCPSSQFVWWNIYSKKNHCPAKTVKIRKIRKLMANFYSQTEKPTLLVSIQYRIILANSTVKQCKDRSRLLLHVPLISISEQEKRNGTFIQTPNFPYRKAFPRWTRLLTPLLSQNTNRGPISRDIVSNQRIPEQSTSKTIRIPIFDTN